MAKVRVSMTNQLTERKKVSVHTDAMLLSLWCGGEIELSREDIHLLSESLEALLDATAALIESHDRAVDNRFNRD